MVHLTALWLPILVSGIAVFLASFVMHMLLRYHRSDWATVPNEDAVMDALRAVPPGDYMMPHAAGPEMMKDPAFQEKVKRGPMATLTIMPRSDMSGAFRRSLGLWFVYCLVVSLFAALVAGGEMGRAEHTHQVVHIVWLASFMGYGLALAQMSIWYRRKWSTTFKSLLDALVYGLVTGLVFAWLWPR
ncbi:MAG TPA: hypothetical protein VFT29_11565 [Gemmatimonadaceae bacterium]|nr:hypothetical protein [Gemmatimonadaceae bacterium]